MQNSSKNTEHQQQGDRFRFRETLYLRHVDEWNRAVVLPHASSSSPPEVKVHVTAAPEDLYTSESCVCVSGVRGLPSQGEECVCVCGWVCVCVCVCLLL